MRFWLLKAREIATPPAFLRKQEGGLVMTVFLLEVEYFIYLFTCAFCFGSIGRFDEEYRVLASGRTPNERRGFCVKGR